MARKHRHEWKNDEMFECGAVTMIVGSVDNLCEEMRQTCDCGAVRYVKKEGTEFSLLDVKILHNEDKK